MIATCNWYGFANIKQKTTYFSTRNANDTSYTGNDTPMIIDNIVIVPKEVYVCETTIPSTTKSSGQRDYCHNDHRRYQEHAFRTALKASANCVSAQALFGRRYKMLFSKSGFVGRAGKRRKGR